MDFGPDGLIGCVDVLTKADIGFFGAGRDLQAARSGLMLDVKGRKIVLLGYNDFRKEDYQATENRAGIMPLNSDWVIEDIRTAKQAWNADIVIPFIHWGNEMNTRRLKSNAHKPSVGSTRELLPSSAAIRT